MKTLLVLIAFATLGGFLGILLWWVPRWDLGLVIGAVVALAAWDLFVHERRGGRSA